VLKSNSHNNQIIFIEVMSLWILLFLSILIVIFAIFPPNLIKANVYGDSQAKRVMLFPPILWHYLTVDMNDTHILAIAKYMKDEVKNSFFTSIFPSVALKDEALTSMGAMPLGIEQIMLLNPDRVLMWEQFSQGLENVYFPGTVKLSNELFNNKEQLYTLFGKITKQQNRSDYLIHRARKNIEFIVQHIPQNTSEISVVVMGNKEKFFLWGSQYKNFNTNLSLLHAKNIVAKSSMNGSTNIETLLMLNPDIIFIPSYLDYPIAPAELYQDVRLRSLNAVKNRRIYKLPNGICRMEGPVEEPILMLWLANVLYPNLQSDTTLRQYIVDTYQKIYNYTLNDIQIDELLQIQYNRGSNGYEIFSKE